jgi:hypothetical protein
MTDTPLTPEAALLLADVLDSRSPRNSDHDQRQAATTLRALAARLAQVEAERDDLKVQLADQRGHKRALREDRNIERQRGDQYLARAEAAEARIAELEAALPAVKVKPLVWLDNTKSGFYCDTIVGCYAVIAQSRDHFFACFDGISVDNCISHTLEAAKAAAQADYEARILSALDLPATDPHRTRGGYVGGV